MVVPEAEFLVGLLTGLSGGVWAKIPTVLRVEYGPRPMELLGATLAYISFPRVNLKAPVLDVSSDIGISQNI
jgi:hypothetical protein